MRRRQSLRRLLGEVELDLSRRGPGHMLGPLRLSAGLPEDHTPRRSDGPARQVHRFPAGPPGPVRRRPATHPVLASARLIGGTTGSGKSDVVNVILAFVSRSVPRCGDLGRGSQRRHGIPAVGIVHPAARHHSRTGNGTVPRRARQLNRRAALAADTGKRSWDPAPAKLALVIIVDKFRNAPRKPTVGRSVARFGPGHGVGLIARPSGPAAGMGKAQCGHKWISGYACGSRGLSAVDVILGRRIIQRRMARPFAYPGQCVPDIQPRALRARKALGLLDTDDQMPRHAAETRARPASAPGRSARYATDRPQNLHRRPETTRPMGDDGDGPEAALWAALLRAAPEGAPIADLMAACGMGRSRTIFGCASTPGPGARRRPRAGHGGPCGRGTGALQGSRHGSATSCATPPAR